MIRMFLFGIVAVFVAAYGVVRYYTHPRQPMVVPVPAETHDSGEIPAPEIIPVPAHS